MNTVQLVRCANPDELARVVAAAWMLELATARHAGAPQCVALSGGRIALKFFAAAVALAQTQQISLVGVHFFWADERCVPPDDAQSNFAVATESFFRPLGLTASQIHRILGEQAPERAAELAATELQRFAPQNAAGQPVLDLIFLGMGEDGHVASLFPGEPEALQLHPAIYRAVTDAPKPPQRVTLGYAALGAARQVWVLASGAGKEKALRDSLQQGALTPLGRVVQRRALTKIFTDLAGNY